MGFKEANVSGDLFNVLIQVALKHFKTYEKWALVGDISECGETGSWGWETYYYYSGLSHWWG